MMAEAHANDVQAAHAVIMAGGVGARFWPLSRPEKPKQLLPLAGDGTSLLRATFERVRDVVPPERIWVVTNASLAQTVADLLPEMPRHQVLAEPQGRNTAPCIGWAASRVAHLAPRAPIAVLPADHHIRSQQAFSKLLQDGLDACGQGDLVTVGIEPTHPETGYGYIELAERKAAGQAHVLPVERFVEKPDLERAQAFVASGRFLWNSGMFFFRADVILEAIASVLPELGRGLSQLSDAFEQASRGTALDESLYARALSQVFPRLPSISIDHGVMEKVEGGIKVIRGPKTLGWSDLGSWSSAWELAEKDESGNASVGAELVTVDSEGCYALASEGNAGKTIALVGLRDVVVVDTKEALLVLPKGRSQDVKKVTEQLKKHRTTSST